MRIFERPFSAWRTDPTMPITEDKKGHKRPLPPPESRQSVLRDAGQLVFTPIDDGVAFALPNKRRKSPVNSNENKLANAKNNNNGRAVYHFNGSDASAYGPVKQESNSSTSLDPTLDPCFRNLKQAWKEMHADFPAPSRPLAFANLASDEGDVNMIVDKSIELDKSLVNSRSLWPHHNAQCSSPQADLGIDNASRRASRDERSEDCSFDSSEEPTDALGSHVSMSGIPSDASSASSRALSGSDSNHRMYMRGEWFSSAEQKCRQNAAISTLSNDRPVDPISRQQSPTSHFAGSCSPQHPLSYGQILERTDNASGTHKLSEVGTNHAASLANLLDEMYDSDQDMYPFGTPRGTMATPSLSGSDTGLNENIIEHSDVTNPAQQSFQEGDSNKASPVADKGRQVALEQQNIIPAEEDEEVEEDPYRISPGWNITPGYVENNALADVYIDIFSSKYPDYSLEDIDLLVGLERRKESLLDLELIRPLVLATAKARAAMVFTPAQERDVLKIQNYIFQLVGQEGKSGKYWRKHMKKFTRQMQERALFAPRVSKQQVDAKFRELLSPDLSERLEDYIAELKDLIEENETLHKDLKKKYQKYKQRIASRASSVEESTMTKKSRKKKVVARVNKAKSAKAKLASGKANKGANEMSTVLRFASLDPNTEGVDATQGDEPEADEDPVSEEDDGEENYIGTRVINEQPSELPTSPSGQQFDEKLYQENLRTRSSNQTMSADNTDHNIGNSIKEAAPAFNYPVAAVQAQINSPYCFRYTVLMKSINIADESATKNASGARAHFLNLDKANKHASVLAENLVESYKQTSEFMNDKYFKQETTTNSVGLVDIDITLGQAGHFSSHIWTERELWYPGASYELPAVQQACHAKSVYAAMWKNTTVYTVTPTAPTASTEPGSGNNNQITKVTTATFADFKLCTDIDLANVNALTMHHTWLHSTVPPNDLRALDSVKSECLRLDENVKNYYANLHLWSFNSGEVEVAVAVGEEVDGLEVTGKKEVFEVWVDRFEVSGPAN